MSAAHRVVLLPGDGIGPEVVECARRVVEAAGLEVRWTEHLLGLPALEKHGDTLPPETLAAVRECGVALKGPTTTPIGTGHVSANVRLRIELELYANVRPVKTVPGLETPYGPVTSSSSARTPRASTPGSRTSSRPASSRRSR